MAPDHTTEHREARLALGVEASLIPPAEVALPATPAGAIRVMQWNILADGLSLDGFLVQDILEANGDPELKDTSAEGRRAALRASADAVAHARASGDQAGLEALQQQLGTERQRRNLLATVDWRCRWALIRAKITAAAPHIICLEELDHFADAKADLGALGYVCGPPEAQYVPAHSVPGCNSKRTADSYDPAAYLTHLERVGLAFAPKVPSTCRELHMKRVGNEEVDDDGVAIFWRADSFHLIGVDFFSHADKTRSQGAVRVKLRRSAGAETLSVMCSHLPSGASEKDMAERRAVLHGPSSTKASATEHAGPSLCEWYAQAASEGTAIWCMDSNAAPNHASGAPTWMAVMESCNSNGGVASVWEPFFEAASGAAVIGVSPPATVNKMRGPLSGQARKVGEHHCEVIDHIFIAPKASAERLSHVSPPHFYESDEAARAELMPSMAVPSDHAPLIVDVHLKPP